MKPPVYYIRELPNGKHLAEIGNGKGVIDFHHMTDDQALALADSLTTFAIQITEHVSLCQERREQRSQQMNDPNIGGWLKWAKSSGGE